MREFYSALGEWQLDEPIPVRRTVVLSRDDWQATEHLGRGVYLRYGDLPECGFSHDFTYKEHHDGIAVWRAVLTPQGRYILCVDRLAHQAQLTIFATLQQRHLYQAFGEEVATVQDEVPILRECTLKGCNRTQVVPLRWSANLLYEVLRQYPPLQKRLRESGQAYSEPTYEERAWRRVWGAGEGKPAPKHEGAYCPLAQCPLESVLGHTGSGQ